MGAPRGEVAEWLNALLSKSSKGASPSGVRIPLSPPFKLLLLLLAGKQNYLGHRVGVKSQAEHICLPWLSVRQLCFYLQLAALLTSPVLLQL